MKVDTPERIAEPSAWSLREWWPAGVVLLLVTIANATDPHPQWPLVGAALGTTIGVATIWRRRNPVIAVAALLLFQGVLVASRLVDSSASSLLGLSELAGLLVISYSLWRWANLKFAAATTAAMLLGSFLDFTLAENRDLMVILVGTGFWLVPAGLGMARRSQANSRSRLIRHVRSNERDLLARELHDTVAHHISAISIQAQAGRTLAPSDANAAIQALEDIEVTASASLAEMRAMLVALRETESAALSPMPVASDIRDLETNGTESPAVTVRVTGDVEDLTSGVDLAIYRIAREAVTNAVKHGRNVDTISVELRGATDQVALTVSDDGDPAPTLRNPDPGFGLLGMAERATLLGGDLTWGPQKGGGWRVRAELPRVGAGR